MKILDRYIFSSILSAMIFVSVTLAVVIFLTQSIRFLELVVESGAASQTFWVLTALALPRFFEIILPLSLMISILFCFYRMNADSELVIVRAVGMSPLTLARPALILAIITTIALWGVTMWLAPVSLAEMQAKRQEVKAQVSSLIFREGVFNQAGKGLTVYAKKRLSDGTLEGLMIHDGRKNQKTPSTIIAKSGTISPTNEGFQVLVFDGQRQEFDSKTKNYSRLNFDRYTIDIPDKEEVVSRWRQPDERTIFELMSPDETNERDIENKREFRVEINRRAISPLLALSLALIACTALLIGPIDRRGQLHRIIFAILGAILVQGTYIASYNMARNHDLGLALMYTLTLAPIIFCYILLSGHGDALRRKLLYKYSPKSGATPA
ncbi:MAG: LPS export ABC transporter permease LptF [Micavibrio sp.]|nr:LPS export ABC transporter permease LptF [Micavibrio sp.]